MPIHVQPVTHTEPMNAGSSTDSEHDAQSVTLAEALQALKALRAEMADLRMLVRAARPLDAIPAPNRAVTKTNR